MDWTDYNHERVLVDGIMMQTSSGKLRWKALQENPGYEMLTKMDISLEQAKKKAKATQFTGPLQEEQKRAGRGTTGGTADRVQEVLPN